TGLARGLHVRRRCARIPVERSLAHALGVHELAVELAAAHRVDHLAHEREHRRVGERALEQTALEPARYRGPVAPHRLEPHHLELPAAPARIALLAAESPASHARHEEALVDALELELEMRHDA